LNCEISGYFGRYIDVISEGSQRRILGVQDKIVCCHGQICVELVASVNLVVDLENRTTGEGGSSVTKLESVSVHWASVICLNPKLELDVVESEAWRSNAIAIRESIAVHRQRVGPSGLKVLITVADGAIVGEGAFELSKDVGSLVRTMQERNKLIIIGKLGGCSQCVR
jgi:hypothetical protein